MVVASSAKTAQGPVTFNLTVPNEPGTVLKITGTCDNAYSGYTGGGYTGYNAGARATLPPLTFTVLAPPDDGDGVSEPRGYDGNGDGTDDTLQQDVTSVPSATGAGVVTIVAPDADYSLTSVTATAAPAGVDAPIGVIGFNVNLPANVTTADVEVLLPAGVTVDTVLKDLNGTIVDFTSQSTIDLANHKVVLHLVDGGAGDADGLVNGVIVDPVILESRYTFGFVAPVDAGIPNIANAGQTIPVKWRITTASGQPVSNPASFVKLTSKGGACSSEPGDPIEVYAPGSSGLQYLGDGVWQLNWKTDKLWKGQCRTLTLQLADEPGGRTASFKFK
jgi:hypothetical protein